MNASRRAFLTGALAVGATALAPAPPARASISARSYATLINLALCDGCEGKSMPACVSACREASRHKFPEPDPAMLKPYWPQTTFDDWSGKREVFNRLTPYNWTFVQKATVEVNGAPVKVSVPRRCMHCDSPACVKLCPFGVNYKNSDGTVTINPDLCFGGAKCKAVCPWSVPQRQAGVGIYKSVDPIPAGGGVMYKCDLCRDRLKKGEPPACVPACPKKALEIGLREDIYAKADKLAAGMGGYVYGKTENGGASTLYVSPIPFEKIDAAILAAAKEPDKAMRMHRPKNMLEEKEGKAWTALLGPVAGVAVALAATMGGSREEGK